MAQLMRKMRSYPMETAEEIRRTQVFLERIFSSKATGTVFLYFLRHMASTSLLLRVNLRMPEATVYRALKRLSDMKVVTSERRINHKRYGKGGPRPRVWAVPDATWNDMARAVEEHREHVLKAEP